MSEWKQQSKIFTAVFKCPFLSYLLWNFVVFFPLFLVFIVFDLDVSSFFNLGFGAQQPRLSFLPCWAFVFFNLSLSSPVPSPQESERVRHKASCNNVSFNFWFFFFYYGTLYLHHLLIYNLTSHVFSTFSSSLLEFCSHFTILRMGCSHNLFLCQRLGYVTISLLFLLISSSTHGRFKAEGKWVGDKFLFWKDNLCSFWS